MLSRKHFIGGRYFIEGKLFQKIRQENKGLLKESDLLFLKRLKNLFIMSKKFRKNIGNLTNFKIYLNNKVSSDTNLSKSNKTKLL